MIMAKWISQRAGVAEPKGEAATMRSAVMRSAAMIVVGWAAAAMAGGGECDPSYECIYRHGSSDGTSYMFDFSQLCSSTDHVASDSLGHTYYAQICGNANQNCLPASYTETYEYGVAVQMWGDTPSCSPPGCNDPATGRAVCCTASCAVLGTGAPIWQTMDPNNPATGGVKAKFRGAAPSETDPFWCDFNPATGAQFEREVHFVFNCVQSQQGAVITGAVQNGTNDCYYTLMFNTVNACYGVNSGLSGGWIFVIFVLSVSTLYIGVGMLLTWSRERIWAFPNRQFWATLLDYVKEGFIFTGKGFKKDAHSASVYDTIGAGGGTTSYQGSSYHGTAPVEAKSSAYSDL